MLPGREDGSTAALVVSLRLGRFRADVRPLMRPLLPMVW